MRSASSVGLRLAGLLAMAVFVAHCGDSSVRIKSGGVSPSAGAFTGTTGDGGTIAIQVGSIDSIALQCGSDTLVETFSPPAPVADDGTFSVTITDRGKTVHVSGTFTDNNNVDGTINDEDNDCDTTFEGSRTGSAIPTRTSTPTSGATKTSTPVETGETPTPTATPAETSTGATATGGATPTATATPVTGSCPTKLTVTGLGSQADLDTGWTGIAHNQKVVDMGSLTVGLTNCQSPPAGSGNGTTCGVCTVNGPIASTGNINNHRCSAATQTTCVADADCGANGPCAFFFGAPLPLSSGSAPVCVTNQVNGTITGTANTTTGAGAANTALISAVFLGLNNSQPCPVCNSGHCVGGARDGATCTVHGTTTQFGSTSFDCPPLSTAGIGHLNITFNTTTGTSTLNHSAATCGASPDTGKPCFCTGQKHPNQCDDGICTDPAGTGGLCEGGPFDQFCSTKPFVGCLQDADCAADNAGNCQGSPVTRPCTGNSDTTTLAVIGDDVRTGHAAAPNASGFATPTLVATFCVPATSGSGVNTVGGLPGPAALTLPTQSQLFQ